jgi:hypothetical protein
MNAIDTFANFIPFIHEGQVVKTDDPDQMGRVKVWVPAVDGENFEIDALPWADYAPSFFGFTVDYPGGNGGPNNSHTAYGMWAVPKIGASVYIFCVGGDPTRRAYFASSIRLHRNRSLPAGRNTDPNGKVGPWGDAGDGQGNLNPIEPAYSNLRDQFQNKLTESEAITRGLYERQIAQAKQDKDGAEGYTKTPISGESYLDPQTYCWVTPGRHAIIFQDDPAHARARIKTAEGHQVILDDANERIYISTAKGKSWIEMDLDGHIQIFGADSFSVRSGADINLYADKNINMEAGQSINMKADKGDLKVAVGGSIHLNAVKDGFFTVCGGLHQASDGALRLTTKESMDLRAKSDMTVTGGRAMDLNGGSGMKLSASRVDVNGPAAKMAVEADCAATAESPTIVPGHEPWKRPETKGKRNKNWKA